MSRPKRSRPIHGRPTNKLQRLGIVLTEVARATNTGKTPINQKELGKMVRDRYQINIPPTTLAGYVRDLVDGLKPNRLIVEGKSVGLESETTLLTDSKAVQALFIAHTLINSESDDRFSVRDWIRLCTSPRIGISEERCYELLEEYLACEYLDRRDRNEDLRELNMRIFNEDLFYLDVVRDAGLKRRAPRHSN